MMFLMFEQVSNLFFFIRFNKLITHLTFVSALAFNHKEVQKTNKNWKNNEKKRIDRKIKITTNKKLNNKIKTINESNKH